MGIHDSGYRVFKGRVGGRFERIKSIFVLEFLFRIKQRWTIVLLVLSYVLGLLPTVLFTYFMVSFAILAGIMDPLFIMVWYFSFIFIWVVIFVTVIGSPMISNDLKNNSIILYFSRPLNKGDYFLGKFATLYMLVLLVTFIPALLMSATILGLATEELRQFMDIGRVTITLISGSFLMAFVFTSVSLLFSSMTKNYLYAGVGIFTILTFSNLIALLFSEIIHENFTLLSIWQNLIIIADDGAGFNSFSNFDWYNSLAILFSISFISLILTWRKIQRVEVI